MLTLCGWSNTQFSYWARRSEAIACLSQHDDRVAALRAKLEDRIANERWHVNVTNAEADQSGEVEEADGMQGITGNATIRPSPRLSD